MPSTRGFPFPQARRFIFWDVHRSKGIDWYRGLFPDDDGKLCGEITPAYACLPPETIAECHTAFPDVRLMYILRNPIHRAWSAAKMEWQRQRPGAVDAPDDWFVEEFRSERSLARGDYEASLKSWLRFYRKDQLLVLRFEELVEHPASFLARCCRHLGVEPLPFAEASLLRAKDFAGPRDPMRPALQRVLLELYDEKIRSLQGWLGQDLSPWLESADL